MHGCYIYIVRPGVHTAMDRGDVERLNFPKNLVCLPDHGKFDYSVIPPFTAASEDTFLHDLGRDNESIFVSSSSSFVPIMNIVYFALSGMKTPVFPKLSSVYDDLVTC